MDFVVNTLNRNRVFYVTSEDVMARQPDDDNNDNVQPMLKAKKLTAHASYHVTYR